QSGPLVLCWAAIFYKCTPTNARNNMTTKVMELIAHLKIYPGDTVVTIKDVDDVEFAITDFESLNNVLTIVIGSIVDSELDEEEGG
ncbi:hypothetical protein, partial [Nostoc sp. CHAB 5715]|uniref:hypothetical protein n=1 Tax=Nostoc sp. CHAB 5715 TaxID=2780400 RepID=UPI001E543581